jgi:hypothetical protein
VENKNFSFKEVFGYGWKVTKANFWFFVGVGLIIFCLDNLTDLAKAVVSFLDLTQISSGLLFLMLELVGWLIELVFAIGLIKISLDLFSDRKVNFSKLFCVNGCFFKYLLATLLYGLIVLLGLLLFVIPGIIWSIKFSLYGYFIVDKNFGPVDALKASAKTTKGVKLQLLGFYFLSALIFFAGIICFAVGLFAAYPVILIAGTFVYLKLSSQTPELADYNIAAPTQPEFIPPPAIRQTSILGGVILLVVFVAAAVSIFAIWSADAAPIENDYTIADLRSAPAKFNKSYQILLRLNLQDEQRTTAPAIGLDVEDINTVTELSGILNLDDISIAFKTLKKRSNKINLAWSNAKIGREIIDELNTFEQIADITEPDFDADISFLSNLRNIAYLYRAYACLEAENENAESAIKELCKFDSIIRKVLPNIRASVSKLACISIVVKNIKTANLIANNPKVSQSTVELLAKHFKPLNQKQVSMKNQAISDYLMFKRAIEQELLFSKFFEDYSTYEKWYLSTSLKGIFKISSKPNASIRLLRNVVDDQLTSIGENDKDANERFSAWPDFYPNLPEPSIEGEFREKSWIFYSLFNTGGLSAAGVFAKPFEKVCELNLETQIQDDLLQIVMNKRLGRPFTLKARAYSDNYIVDVKAERIFSPGLDGKPNTDDDVYLTINPAALGWEGK